MGGLPCSTAACYRRMATTDEWDSDALWYSSRLHRVDTESFLISQLGKFRYEVHAFALGIEPYSRCRTKAVYLYLDGVRVMAARGTYRAGSLIFVSLEYRSAYWRDLYHDTGEVLPKNRYPLLQHHFSEHFQWFQSGEGSYYTNRWPFTLYKKSKDVTNKEREHIFSTVEISI